MTDKLREEFEALLFEHYMLQSVWVPERNCYEDYPAHLAFNFFQLGREAMRAECVKAAESQEIDAELGSSWDYNNAVRDVTQAIKEIL